MSSPALVCKVEHCNRSAEKYPTIQLCNTHYQKKRTGVPNWDQKSQYEKSEEERFWEKVEVTGFCWNWTASSGVNGHGTFRSSRGFTPSHRYSYETLVGPIPNGLVIDHLCRNPPCVNPDHLQPVSFEENVARGFGPTAVNARKAECVNGHPLVESNIYYEGTSRKCRECRRKKGREWARRQSVKRGVQQVEKWID